ncbi:MAG: threonine--tRNA ligase [Synergistes jonesii]|uniref:threonine--tRNA ligase n=1 Tax=Synergistes jonesii TaxID=2754 RepID=UPI002A747A4A|nr:threonine--tRNA ligase [Synergistes jonesii]MDY2984727.1 threonine--tRNA ligase [Synergistes jonesii]
MVVFSTPDGKKFEADSATVRQLLEVWRLKKAIGATVGGEIVDCDKVFTEDTAFTPLFPDCEEGLQLLRHSTAHLLAHAVLHLYPEAKFGIGPAIKDGFYYDIRFPKPISDEDLPKIEAEMRKISQEKIPLVRSELTKEEAVKKFSEMGEDLKVELIEGIEGQALSIYTEGDFSDFCRGPHVPHTGCCKFFKLLSIAGAYWHGDEKNEMLTRVYGTAFGSEEELKAYLKRLEEAKARDHRKLGRELDLFSLHNEGPGFPFFHPKGMVVMNALQNFWRREHTKRGYVEIKTPMILDRDLWLRSGHWDHYKENMYFTEIDDVPFAIKPMNCPGGILVYKNDIHSYRELPIRMAELGFVHRHERSGALHGLMRVRAFTQDDAHIYCTPEQIKDEIKAIMELDRYVYQDVFGFKYHVELSTRPQNSMGDQELWDLAEHRLKEALEETGASYKLNPGDGAFYGPKIDFHLEDCIGRTWQCGTIQLDFQMPEKFDMTYIGKDGAEHRPVMLHRTILGSLERFMGILIENYAGAFPFWLAPVQAKLLPVGADYVDYAEKMAGRLKNADIRVEIDTRDEKLGKKIRDAQLQKVPYMLVIGAKEAENGTLSVRERKAGDLGPMTFEEFIAQTEKEFDPINKK